MIVTVSRQTEGHYDESGNWIEGTTSTHQFEIERRSFQPGVHKGYFVVTETALSDMNYWTLFLHNDEDVQKTDVLTIDSKDYEVVGVFNYTTHKEVIVYESSS
jgi:hypothetical protein